MKYESRAQTIKWCQQIYMIQNIKVKFHNHNGEFWLWNVKVWVAQRTIFLVHVDTCHSLSLRAVSVSVSMFKTLVSNLFWGVREQLSHSLRLPNEGQNPIQLLRTNSAAMQLQSKKKNSVSLRRPPSLPPTYTHTAGHSACPIGMTASVLESWIGPWSTWVSLV